MERLCACGCRTPVMGVTRRYVQGHQLKGKAPWNKGKAWSADARAKMSAARMGKPPANKGCNPERTARRECACGCGQEVVGWCYRRNAPKQFVSGHNSRLPGACRPPLMRGADHPNFRNGLTVHRRDGRLLVAQADGRRIPHSNVVAEALLLRRRLRENEVVHHKDGNPANDATANLVVLTRAEHVRLHDPRGWAGNGA